MSDDTKRKVRLSPEDRVMALTLTAGRVYPPLTHLADKPHQVNVKAALNVAEALYDAAIERVEGEDE